MRHASPVHSRPTQRRRLLTIPDATDWRTAFPAPSIKPWAERGDGWLNRRAWGWAPPWRCWARRSSPFRGILLGLFFLIVGMSLNLGGVVAEWPLVIGGLLAFMTAKMVAVYAVARLNQKHGEGLTVASAAASV
ncbi:cation:proton antiporter [Brevundimonas sp.]|uniref:cation:proton antiporter domain-containing protein n=1 Tax=Brevundimonas sp. TaxID=1871086 RepID=UPI00356640E9